MSEVVELYHLGSGSYLSLPVAMASNEVVERRAAVVVEDIDGPRVEVCLVGWVVVARPEDGGTWRAWPLDPVRPWLLPSAAVEVLRLLELLADAPKAPDPPRTSRHVSRKSEAMAWLQVELEGGPVGMAELRAAGMAARGYRLETLDRARDALGLVELHHGRGPLRRVEWALPARELRDIAGQSRDK